MMKFRLNLLSTFLFSLLAMACSKKNDNPEPPEVDNSIHKASFLDYELTPTNKVNVIFQLSDENSMPYLGLSAGDVKVSEDGSNLNSVENAFEIKGIASNNFFPLISILLDVNSSSDSTLDNLKNTASDLVDILPSGSSIQIITYSSNVEELIDFTADRTKITTALDGLTSGNEGSNLYSALDRSISDLNDSISVGASFAKSGIILVIGSNGDTEATDNIDDLNKNVGGIKTFAISLGGKTDSALNNLNNYTGIIANTSAELGSKTLEFTNALQDYEKSIYVFSYESEKSGDTEVAVSFSTSKSVEGENIEFTYIPSLFFTPDSFEIKSDEIRYVSNGKNRRGSILVRKDVRNDSVDFQIFSGYEKSDYKLIFVNRDPAIFGDWVSLNNDPDVIKINIAASDFILDMGYQSAYVDPEIFNRKYMVIRDENNRKDLAYFQMKILE